MKNYTEQQLRDAISSSTSYRQVLLRLGLSPQGGNSETIKRLATKHEIDTSHFGGKSQKGRPKRIRSDIGVYLTNQQRIGSFRLKNRLLREGILLPICSCCNGERWLDGPIPLELDHIDGNSSNNVLSNLRLLCPNCHALTATYRGKNQRRACKLVGETGLEPVRSQ